MSKHLTCPPRTLWIEFRDRQSASQRWPRARPRARAANYEGHLAVSWPVLLRGPWLADQVLGAPRDTKESPADDPAGKEVSRRRPELLAAHAHLWSKAESYLYTDSASSAGKYPDTLAGHFGAWSLSDNQWTGPGEAKAPEWPEAAWLAGERTRWRDGSEPLAQEAWFRYQPGRCAEAAADAGAASAVGAGGMEAARPAAQGVLLCAGGLAAALPGS